MGRLSPIHFHRDSWWQMPSIDEDDYDRDGYDADEHSADEYGDPTEPLAPCPHCGEEIYEDAERCPHCSRYLSDEVAPPARKSWLIVIGTAVSLYIVYHWLVG